MHQSKRPGLVLAVTTRAVTFAASFAYTVSALADATPIKLTIENAASGPNIRCQVILAHFVTHDLPTIPASQSATIEMDRATDGTLFFRKGGQTMATENILCGLDQNWTVSRNDLDLRALRIGTREALQVTCSGATTLTCRSL